MKRSEKLIIILFYYSQPERMRKKFGVSNTTVE
jgi:hypothetical protein